MVKSTIFETEWNNANAPFLYRFESSKVNVGIIADAFPKFPDQVVLIPANGFPERETASLHDLDFKTQMALAALEAAIQSKMESFSGIEGVRGIVRVDGFAVPNHPHKVMFPGLRGESDDFTKPPRSQFRDDATRALLVQRALENLRLSTEEVEQLNEQLSRIASL